MKRILIYIATVMLLLTSCGTANKTPVKEKGWLQTTFLGNTFGDSYRSVKFRMNQNFRNLSDENDVLTYVQVEFGGGKWDMVNLYFDDERHFCKVIFEQSFSTEIGARRWYDSLREELEKKYGPAKEISDGIGYIDNADITLTLTTFQAESRGGSLRWYCRLEYSDLDAIIKNSYRVNPDL